MRIFSLLMALFLLSTQAFAQGQQRPQTSNYVMPSDVQAVGGGEGAQSNNYLLDDTIGEATIGPWRSTNYDLNAGYRQTVESFISMNCTASVSLGTIARTGDSSVNTCGSAGYCATNRTVCTVTTDSAAGYALSWVIQTGTGAAGARTGTGHLNGYKAGNRIAPLGTGSTTMSRQPIAMVAGAGTLINDARWAGRLSSTSTTAGGAGLGWGSDGVSDTWLRVATGSAVNIANRTSRTSVSGDTENIGFRAIIHGNANVANDAYKTTVVFTAIAN